MKIPTIEELEDNVGFETDKWHGHCYGVASDLAEMIKGAKAVYGHWLGAVDEEGYWARHVKRPFIQHGWVVLEDGTILDPTRFSFENVEPYIWIGENDGNYDQGGNQWMEMLMITRPFPKHGEGWNYDVLHQITLHENILNHMRNLSQYAELFPIPIKSETVTLHSGQLFWFANCPLSWLEPYTKEIYEVIRDSGNYEYIPIDNRREVCVDP